MNVPENSSALSRERFGFTLFLSLSVHAVIILGLGFSVFSEPSPPAMEITLAQYRSERPPEDADFLAQANQQGSGQLDQASAPSSPVEAPFHAEEIRQSSPMPEASSAPSHAAEVLSYRAQSDDARPAQDSEASEQRDKPRERRSERELALASLQAQLDLKRQAYAKRPRRHTLSSASTREAREALYLDAWRKRIELIGNQHYPQDARREGIYGTLRLLVALRQDGSVQEVRVLRSSGEPLLDEAAIRIVHLAAPFAPFPDNLRGQVDILEIIRTWQFHQGQTTTFW